MEIRKILGWEYILTFGIDLDLYGKGNQRKMINRGTGEEVLNYTFKK